MKVDVFGFVDVFAFSDENFIMEKKKSLFFPLSGSVKVAVKIEEKLKDGIELSVTWPAPAQKRPQERSTSLKT